MNDAFPSERFDAVVIGAGFAGLYQVYKLREMGLSVIGMEQGGAPGGVWYWNRYPGARTDSPSSVYQYFFSQELHDEWQWDERFSGQMETERYLNFVADRLDLHRHFRFNTRVSQAVWEENERRWLLSSDRGDAVSARYVIGCCGPLTEPYTPDYPGIDTFAGDIVHTCRWPQDGVDLKGRRVGVLGTGATGMQVIQSIASEVQSLTVFQRTANYSLPMRNPKLTDEDHQTRRAEFANTRDYVWNSRVGMDCNPQERPWHDVPPDERRQILESLWADGSLKFWAGGFQEMLLDADINSEITRFAVEKIRARINDPAIAEQLIPPDHGFGLRRVPLESGYYEAYNRDNVRLVDLRAEPIEKIAGNAVCTSTSEYPLDVLILATGFNAGTGALGRIDIQGREGRKLADDWSRNISATLGMQVTGYPNLFLTGSPLAPAAGFCNVPVCLQQQVDWISDCIAHVQQYPLAVIEPTPEREAEWVEHHDEMANMTLLMKTDSWWNGGNVKGKQRRLISYVGGVGNYNKICAEVAASGYAGFDIA